MHNIKDLWDTFGYPTDDPCAVCGCRPAKLEPRFYYAVCEKHMNVPPTKVCNMEVEYDR